MITVAMRDVSILGCGWLGLPLAIHLLKNDFAVKGSTTSVEKIIVLKEEKIAAHLVDISKESNKAIDQFLNSEVLIVAIPSKDVDGFKRFMPFIEQSAIKKVVFISSTSVYPSLNIIVTEESETVNSPLVTIEKSFLENKNFKTTIIRFAGLMGEGRNPGNWFVGRKIPQPKGFVNMIHQDDCIGIIHQIIKQDVFGEVFNACSNHHPTRKEFYTNAKKLLKKEPPIFDDSLPLKYKIINADKIQKRLNYIFKFDDLLAI
ncbi:MAG: dTDP-glucose 4,6-dehydratase [Tenacibaculum sp.]